MPRSKRSTRKATATPKATQLSPNTGSGSHMTKALEWQRKVYEADPTGGQPSRY